MLHIFASTLSSFERYLDFIDPRWDGPVIIDSFDSKTRVGMAMYVTEIGYADRTVYNSIGVASSEEEMRAITESDVDSTIILAFHPLAKDVDSRMNLLTQEGGLLSVAKGIGINNILIDAGVAPLGSGAGAALRFTVVAKAKLGLPVGSGMHNAASSWEWLRSQEKSIRLACDASTAALQLLAGGDFLLYGPIENAKMVFPVAAMTDIMISEALEEFDVWPVWSHPRNKLT